MIENTVESLINQPNFIQFLILFISLLTGFVSGTIYWRIYRWKSMEKKFKKQSRAVLTGQIGEQFAPFLPNFPYKPSESKYIGKPIDFIIFHGLDDEAIQKVVFVEVKSGKHRRLSKTEKSLKHAIQQQRVEWCQYNFDL